MKHHPLKNLGSYAHKPKPTAEVRAPSPKKVNVAGPSPHQVGRQEGKLIGKTAPPANVSKPRMK